MPLIKTRPNVRLLLERRLVAGELGVFVVELECPKPLPVAKVSFALLGHVVWFTTSQYGRHRHTSRFLAHELELPTAHELGPGVHRLGTRLRLSANLPGSWEGDRLAIEYSVVVHVDIPWWPDVRVEFAVRVGAAPGSVDADEGAVVYASHAGGPPLKAPYLELSLGQRSVRAGAPMQLSAALGNVERNRYRKLDVAIVAQESMPTGLGGHYTHEHVFGRWSVGLDNHPGELQPIPFNLDLPRVLTPAFDLHGCKLQWLMQIEADVAWGVNPKLRFPIVVEAGKPIEKRELTAPLAVGSDRLRLIWSAVGKATGLEYVDGSLHGVVGSIGVAVHRSQHDGEARVVGLLEFPSLGVGLQSQRARRGLLGNVAVELVTRDLEQTRVVAERLGPGLAHVPGELELADDGRLRFAVPGPGLELDGLREFVQALVGLAPALEQLPAALPAPAVVHAQLDAWRRAAVKLGATLRIADLQLEFNRDGQRIRVGTTYDDAGQPRATVIELDPGVAIPSRHHLLWTGDFGLPHSELAIAELTRPPSWARNGRVTLQIDANGVRLSLPAPLPDPTVERPRFEALLALGRALRGEQAPYR